METIICALVETSYAEISREERHRIGITDALLRFSVGIENSDDLLADFSQALNGK